MRMRHDAYKHLVTLFLFFFCFFEIKQIGLAAKPSDVKLDHPCKMEIRLETEDGILFEIRDREIHVMKIATPKLEEERVVFVAEDAFADSGIDLSDIGSKETANAVCEYSLKHKNEELTGKTDEEGVVCFEGLEVGLYLITVKNSDDGVVFLPFLASLPHAEETEWNYYVIATPKCMKPGSVNYFKDVSVKKLWNDNGKNRPASIVVELLKNGGYFDEVTLSAENGWKHTWSGLSVLDDWSVREKEVPQGYVVTYGEEDGVLCVINSGSLIQTGQLNWPIPACAGLGMIFMGTGAYFRRLGRKRSSEAGVKEQ